MDLKFGFMLHEDPYKYASMAAMIHVTVQKSFYGHTFSHTGKISYEAWKQELAHKFIVDSMKNEMNIKLNRWERKAVKWLT